MIRKIVLLFVAVSLAFAGCIEGDNTTQDAESSTGDDGVDPTDGSVPSGDFPPEDDPGWQPFGEGEGIPREIMPQQFERIGFYQEPEAAAEEHGGEGTPGFDMEELDAMIGPLEDGYVYNSGQSFPPTWDIVFHDVNWDNRSVLFEHMVEDGEYFDVEGLPGGMTVLLKDNETMLVNRLDVEEGGTFDVTPESEFASAGFSPGHYRVVSVDDETVHMDHHPGEYAQQDPHQGQDPYGQDPQHGH